MDTMIGEATQDMLREWRELQAQRRQVDIAREMAALTLTVTTMALFGVKLGSQVRMIGEMVNQAVGLLEKPSDPRVRESMDQLDAVVESIIKQRRANFHDQGDLLSSMMLERDRETGEAMSDAELRDQIMTLMLAGYETTASALTWTWYLLSQNPGAVDRLRAEAKQVLGGRPPQFSDIERLPYTGQVLNEAMRLSRPRGSWVAGAGRDEMGGYYVAPGPASQLPALTATPDSGSGPRPSTRIGSPPRIRRGGTNSRSSPSALGRANASETPSV
jgi:cytochrome P450